MRRRPNWEGSLRKVRNEDGIALVMALGILIVLGLLAAVVIAYTTSGQRTASRSSAGVSAYSLAEAGINNAMSILGKQKNAANPMLLPDNSAARPANITPYDGGTTTVPPYTKWWGEFSAPLQTWKLTSIGYMRNPTGSPQPVTRKVTVSVRVRPSFMQPTNNPAWNYIIATRTGTPKGCDESLYNAMNMQSPMYVLGNLCLNTPSKISGGPLHVKGSVTLDVNTSIGSSSAPISEVHVKNGCSYKKGPYVSPCTPTQHVWANQVDTQPIDLELPTADFASWYRNSAPGPRQACTSQSGTVPVFDNNGMWDVPNGSVPGVFNLTPRTSSYSCVVQSGSAVVGQLSWSHTTKTLTILGTVFIDGSATVNYGFSNVPVHYEGTGTIYLGGTLLFSNTQLCADINAAGNACDFPNWNPNNRFLVFVVNGIGGQGQQVSAGDGVQMVSSSFEGGLFSTNAIELNTTSRTQGPMFAGSEIFANTVFAQTWPLITVPIGMPGTIVTDALPDPPSDYSG
jgi:hypothetical protein